MRNETHDPDPDSAFLLGVVYSVYALVGVPANLFVVIATLASESLRSVHLNIFVLSLSLGDLLYLISACSSLVWAVTFDRRVCQIGGIGFYTFVMLSIITTPCLAISRYAVVSRGSILGAKFKFLKTRGGILLINGLVWTFVIAFPIPFVVADKFGLDDMGVCGVESFNSIPLLIYYVLGLLCVLFISYATTLVFYRKLDQWVRETSSGMSRTAATEEIIGVTRNLLMMMKWIMLLPFVTMAPATVVQALLRYDSDIVTTRTARIFMSTVPLCTVLDPFITVFFIRSYRNCFLKLLPGKRVYVADDNMFQPHRPTPTHNVFSSSPSPSPFARPVTANVPLRPRI